MTKLSPQQLKEQHQQKMMERLTAGYEQYKNNHPHFKRGEEERERKRKDWPKRIKKVLPKPKVKYTKSKGGVRYKLTLLATIRGPEARAMIESQRTGEGHVYSYEPKSMDKLEIYHEEIITPLD